MSAFVSLAFGWLGRLEEHVPRLMTALRDAGLRLEQSGEVREHSHESFWGARFLSEDVPVICRCYDEGDWVATTLDIDEEQYETIGNRHGRAALADEVVRFCQRLFPLFGLRYAFFDEEAEADIDPREYTADVLFGITLVADEVPGLSAACQREDILRCDPFEGGVVLYRRPDPVPHFEPHHQDGSQQSR